MEGERKLREAFSSIRVRLMGITLAGLIVTMAAWGYIQLRSLDHIITAHQLKALCSVTETIGHYYQHFPTGPGFTVLDDAVKDQLRSDTGFARIDIFSVTPAGVFPLTGASRISWDWPDSLPREVAKDMKPRLIRTDTDDGPVLGYLYPLYADLDANPETQIVIGAVSFSMADHEILFNARMLLMLSTLGLMGGIVLVLMVGYNWIIDHPLKSIIETISSFQSGDYTRRVRIAGSGEWRRLSGQFNTMADEIESVLQHDQELNRQLHERVLVETSRVIELQSEVNRLQRLTTLGYLTATLAHDLGTPIHSIAGLARLLLERGKWAPDVTRKLELIVQQTDRLDAVIRNVRRATRLPGPHFESIKASDLLDDIRLLLEPLIQQADVRISVDVSDDLPDLYIDRYRMQSALFNLVQNAMEAVGRAGEIRLSACRETGQNGVAISVCDNGPGIPSDIRERIFEPFISGRPSGNGLCGLGLAIVKDIVSIHGGDIRIESRHDGSGTRFTLLLPGVPPSDPSPSLASV